MPQQQPDVMDQSGKQSQTATPGSTVQRLDKKPGVLVADDDHLVRIMVQLALERHGFDVWLAPNSREAIDLYREHKENIAVVLLDVQMPGLDGPETLEVLREMNPEVPACFMSDDRSAYKPEELLQHGAAYIIAKPFVLDNLANILRLLAHGVPAALLPSGGVFRK